MGMRTVVVAQRHAHVGEVEEVWVSKCDILVGVFKNNHHESYYKQSLISFMFHLASLGTELLQLTVEPLSHWGSDGVGVVGHQALQWRGTRQGEARKDQACGKLHIVDFAQSNCSFSLWIWSGMDGKNKATRKLSLSVRAICTTCILREPLSNIPSALHLLHLVVVGVCKLRGEHV
jgi:hypothetical protein